MSRSTGRPEEDTDRVVVVALYDKVTLLDVAAPLEVFARANDFGTGIACSWYRRTASLSGPQPLPG
jgi:hypothetical protein